MRMSENGLPIVKATLLDDLRYGSGRLAAEAGEVEVEISYTTTFILGANKDAFVWSTDDDLWVEEHLMLEASLQELRDNIDHVRVEEYHRKSMHKLAVQTTQEGQ